MVAYDSRGHGESGGAFCTYGFLEKRDLRRVIDIMPPRPVVLIGASLGGAVALGPRPSLDAIRVGLAGNLCRCTGYEAIYTSIRKANSYNGRGRA